MNFGAEPTLEYFIYWLRGFMFLRKNTDKNPVEYNFTIEDLKEIDEMIERIIKNLQKELNYPING